MTGQHPYSPAEILDMGRRAEFEGNLDYASQFYSYLIEGLPGTREADEARIGMERVAQLRDRLSSAPDVAQNQPPAAQPAYPHHNEVPRTGPSSSRLSPDTAARPFGSQQQPNQRAEPSLSAPSGRPGAGSGQPQSPRQATASGPHRGAPPPNAQWNPVSVADGDEEARQPLPRVMRRDEENEDEVEFQPGYKIGRFLAFAIVLLGWLSLVGGIAFAAIAIAGVAGAQPLADYFGLPFGVVVGLAAMTSGLFMVFIGSLAQAAFEAANNTRELLEIERAKAGW